MSEAAGLVEVIVREVPDLREAYERHTADHRELLPHIFMAEVVRFVLEQVNNPEMQSSLIRLMGRLDEGLRSGHQDVCDLVGTSFCENLIGETSRLRQLWPLMGPSLRKDVENFCGTEWLDVQE